MSKTMDKLAKELKAQMNASDARKPKPYDAQAEVLRVEDGVAWVHIPGGVEETPVRLTINAKKGDMVNIRVANGSAWITGNGTNPPTDDSTANYAVDITNSLNKDVVVLNTVVAENIEATNARFGYVEADTAKIHDLTADQLTASVGYIADLTADNITAGDISAASGYIKDLVADHITAGDIIADHATIDDLDANYAKIDIANVNNAWIENGTIKKAEVFDENVFDLSGNRATLSRLDASKINVANLRADNLIVRRINGQPVVGGYTLIDSNSPGYSSKNPQALGWYEFINAQWVLSTDTTVDMTKAYYQEGNEVSLYDQAYIDSLEDDLQQQIDGAVETFTGSVVPTLTNWPYTDWYDTSVTPVHDERAKHVGDIYYVVNSSSPQGGYCYRFAYDNTTHAYSWVLIKDSDVTKALSDISELQTFESETTSWIEETDEGLETIRTNYTALSGRVDDVEDTANAALPATTFETFESTTFTDLVDEVDEQSTTMTNMTTRLGLNADGTGSSTDIVSKESALEQTVDGISTRVGKTEAHLIGMYATSSTAAGTAAKVATITPAIPSGTTWELSTGTTITVKFTNANTTASPTLNVNSKGAKPIKTYANGNLTEAEYKWKAGSTFTFTYNGTNWLMQDSTASVRMTSNETSITQNADAIKLEAVSREMAVNLLLDSDAPTTTKVNAAADRYWSDGGNTQVTCSNFQLTDSPEQGIKYGRRFVCDGTNTTTVGRGFCFYNTNDNIIPYSPNTTYTATWWARCTSGAGKTRIVYPNGGTGNIGSPDITLTSTWQKCTATFTISSALNTNYNRIWFQGLFSANTTGTVEICGCKLVAGDAVEQYKTTIEQTSNNVLIKATRSGATDADKSAGGTSAVGLINVTPDNVKIKAKHVEIDGSAIFNAISDDVDGAIGDAVDDIKIGGRNLHKDSANLGASWAKNNATISGGVGTISLAGTGEHRIYQMPINGFWGRWEANTTYTVSVDAKTDTSGLQLSIEPYAGGVSRKVFSLTTEWARYTYTFTSNANTSTSSCSYFAINGSSGSIFIRNPKLEYGNKATDWTPAPEDIQVGGKNLAAKARVKSFGTNYTESNYVYQGSYGNNAGLKFEASLFTVGEQYTLSYKIKKISGTQTGIGGHHEGFTCNEFRVDDVASENIYSYGAALPDDTNNHKVEVHLTYNGNAPNDNNLYIQPNRYHYTGANDNVFQIWDLKLEKGNTATDWTPAPEDVQAEIDAKKSVHTLTAYNSATATTIYTLTYASLLNYSKEGTTGLNAYVSSIDGVRIGDTVRMAYAVSDMNNAVVYIVGTVTNLATSSGKPYVVYTAHGLDTTIIDGGNILTNSIGANQIQANSIGAKHITISDHTNLVRSNEIYESSLDTQSGTGGMPKISNGYLIKYNPTNTYLMGTTMAPSNFKTNDEIYYEFTGHAEVAGEVYINCWGYSNNSSSVIATNGAAISLTTSDVTYSGYFKLGQSGWSSSRRYTLGFSDARSIKSQIYIKKWVMRRKSGGELIVDGSITTDKLHAEAVTAAKIKAGTITADKIATGAITVGQRNYLLNSDKYINSNGNYYCTTSEIIPKGTKVTISVYIHTYTTSKPDSSTGYHRIGTEIALPRGDGTNQYVGAWKQLDGSAEEKRIYSTYTLDAAMPAGSTCGVYVQGAAASSWVGRPMLYIGDSATALDWSAAPEDLPNDLASASGTTVINGGHITTGTIDASKATITNINASNIKSGTLSADRIAGNSLSVGKFDSTAQDYIQKGVDAKTELTVQDTRSTNQSPKWYIDTYASKQREVREFKLANNIGCGSSAIYGYLTTKIPWADSSGGYPKQTFEMSGRLYVRHGTSDTAWSSWKDVAGIADTYITQIDSAGIFISPSNQSPTTSAAGNSVKINGSGMEIYKGGTSIAFYGDSVRVGSASSNRIEIDSSGFDVRDADGFLQFSIQPSTTSTSHTASRSVGTLQSGQTKTTSLPKNVTSFTAKVTPASGSTVTQSISIPGTAAGSQTSATVSSVTFTLRRQSLNGYIGLTMKATALARNVRYSYASPRRVAYITAGGYDLCYSPGDWIIDYYWHGSGYLTNSKTNIWVTLPVNKPIIAENVTVSNVYLITRQEVKYTHGSSADTDVSWTVESASLQPAGVQVCLSRSTTTNAANNSPIGIDLSCDMSFS